MEYFPKVSQVIPGEGYAVYAYFTDGSVRLFDASGLINQGGVFAPLRDKSVFDRALTVLNDTVAWDIAGKRDPCDCVDIDPFSVYSATRVTDPLLQSG